MGGSEAVVLSGCAGHARYGMTELGEQSAKAPQVRMRRNCKMGNCACGPKGTTRCVGFEQSISDEGKEVNNRAPSQKGKLSGSIATSTRYRYSADCVRGYNAK
eukprot:2227648-Pleurochrysis_carterae.AAC.1